MNFNNNFVCCLLAIFVIKKYKIEYLDEEFDERRICAHTASSKYRIFKGKFQV